jgi:hypothetical protein
VKRRVPLSIATSFIIVFSQTAPRARFEVASVKPASPDTQTAFLQVTPGRLRVQKGTPRALSVLAYGIEGWQLSADPRGSLPTIRTSRPPRRGTQNNQRKRKTEALGAGGFVFLIVPTRRPPSQGPGQPRPAFCDHPHCGVEGRKRSLDGKGISMADWQKARPAPRPRMRLPSSQR